MLPLGLIFLAGSAGTAGALIAAFSITSALTPARGRVVDRHGARALTAFAVACGLFAWALVAASLADVPTVALVGLSALVGLVAPPLGPFTRAAYGRMLGEREELLQRSFGLDSAGEEAAVIFAPLLDGAARRGVLARGGGRDRGRGAARGHGRDGARRRREPSRSRSAAAGASRSPPRCGCSTSALAVTAASLGAIDISLPAAARENGHFSAAGVAVRRDGGRHGGRQPGGRAAAPGAVRRNGVWWR